MKKFGKFLVKLFLSVLASVIGIKIFAQLLSYFGKDTKISAIAAQIFGLVLAVLVYCTLDCLGRRKLRRKLVRGTGAKATALFLVVLLSLNTLMSVRVQAASDSFAEKSFAQSQSSGDAETYSWGDGTNVSDVDSDTGANQQNIAVTESSENSASNNDNYMETPASESSELDEITNQPVNSEVSGRGFEPGAGSAGVEAASDIMELASGIAQIPVSIPDNIILAEVENVRLGITIPSDLDNGSNYDLKYWFSRSFAHDIYVSPNDYGYYDREGNGTYSIPLSNYNKVQNAATTPLSEGRWFLYVWIQKTKGQKELAAYSTYNIDIYGNSNPTPENPRPQIESIEAFTGFIAEEYNIAQNTSGSWEKAGYKKGEVITIARSGVDLFDDSQTEVEVPDYGSRFGIDFSLQKNDAYGETIVTVISPTGTNTHVVQPEENGHYQYTIISNSRGSQMGRDGAERYKVTINVKESNGENTTIFEKTFLLWNDCPTLDDFWLTSTGQIYAVTGILFAGDDLTVTIIANDPTYGKQGLIYDFYLGEELMDVNASFTDSNIVPTFSGHVNPAEIINDNAGFLYSKVRDPANNSSKWKLLDEIKGDSTPPAIDFNPKIYETDMDYAIVTISDSGVGFSHNKLESSIDIARVNGRAITEFSLSEIEISRETLPSDNSRVMSLVYRVPLLENENEITVGAVDNRDNRSFDSKTYYRSTAPAPALTGTVNFAGEAVYGKELTANIDGIMLTSGLAGNALIDTLLYQWLRDGIAIEEAVYPTYVIGQKDIGHMLAVSVTSNEYSGAVTGVSSSVKKAPQAAPIITYEREDSVLGFEGVKLIILTPSDANALYSLDGINWSAKRQISVDNNMETITLFAYLDETETHEKSETTCEIISIGKSGQPSPEVCNLLITPNESSGEYGTYSVQIREVSGGNTEAEYSFDNVSYGANRELAAYPGSAVTGYVRYKASEYYNASAVTASGTEWLPLFTVAKPTATPNGAHFVGSQSIELSCETPNAQIYYTLDGETPNVYSKLYKERPITLNWDTKLKVIAVKENMEDSQILEAEYTKASGDAALNSLKVAGLDLLDTPETADSQRTDFKVSVPYYTEEVTITAATKHEKAYVDGEGRYFLNIGENSFVISVTAEDKVTVKNYTVTVIRQKKEKAVEENVDNGTLDEQPTTQLDEPVLLPQDEPQTILVGEPDMQPEMPIFTPPSEPELIAPPDEPGFFGKVIDAIEEFWGYGPTPTVTPAAAIPQNTYIVPKVELYLKSSGEKFNNNVVGYGAFIQAEITNDNDIEPVITFIVERNGITESGEYLDNKNQWSPSKSGKYKVTLSVRVGNTSSVPKLLEFTYDVDAPKLTTDKNSYSVDETVSLIVDDMYSDISEISIELRYNEETINLSDWDKMKQVRALTKDAGFERNYGANLYQYIASESFSEAGFYFVKGEIKDSCGNKSQIALQFRVGIADSIGNVEEAKELLNKTFFDPEDQSFKSLFHSLGADSHYNNGDGRQVATHIDISADKIREQLADTVEKYGIVIGNVTILLDDGASGKYDRFFKPVYPRDKEAFIPDYYNIFITIYDNRGDSIFDSGRNGIPLSIYPNVTAE